MSNMKTEMIRAEDIRLDGGTQPRAKIDEAQWREYGERMLAGDRFPPITVFYDGQTYWLADGFHRFYANFICRPGEPVECEVVQGTLSDAQWYSYTVNRGHGLRRTNADKERAVRAAIVHPNAEGLSNGDIAAHIGVSDEMVRKHRSKVQADYQRLEVGRPSENDCEAVVARSPEDWRPRKGRDGRTINTAKIGRKSQRPRSPTEFREAKQEGRRCRFPSMVKLELPNNHVHNCAFDLLEYFTFEYLREVFAEIQNIHRQRCDEGAPHE